MPAHSKPSHKWAQSCTVLGYMNTSGRCPDMAMFRFPINENRYDTMQYELIIFFLHCIFIVVLLHSEYEQHCDYR